MFSALPPIADIAQRYWHVRFVPIVLKKSFLGDGRKFLGPLMRFVRGDVRDHTFLRKTTTSFVSALRSIAVAESAKNQLLRNFGVARFSTFATLSATNGLAD